MFNMQHEGVTARTMPVIYHRWSLGEMNRAPHSPVVAPSSGANERKFNHRQGGGGARVDE